MATEAQSEGEVPARESGRRYELSFWSSCLGNEAMGWSYWRLSFGSWWPNRAGPCAILPLCFASAGTEAQWSRAARRWALVPQTAWLCGPLEVRPWHWLQTDQLVVAALPARCLPAFALSPILTGRNRKPSAVKWIPQRHTALGENSVLFAGLRVSTCS